MPLVIATSKSDAGIQYALAANHFYVPRTVDVLSVDSWAVSGSGGNAVQVLGTVGGFRGLQLGNTAAPYPSANSRVTVATSGAIVAQVEGISFFGSSSRVVNYGDILGESYGIRATGAAGVASLNVINYGAIHGGLQAIGVVTGGDARIANHGSISSPAVAIYTDVGNDLLINRGRIEGFVNLYAGNDTLRNYGTINGDLTMGTGNDRLVNRGGTIDGSASFSTGNDTLLNRGTITASVDLGAGDDLLDNRGGTIEGNVTLGDGDDTFTPGTATESVDAGAGIDTIDASRSAGIKLLLGDIGPAPAFIQDDTYYGFEIVLGSAGGNDTLIGDSGPNRLFGNAGNDTLDGGAGLDKLSGGPGDDVLIDGNGLDELTGGSGADRFVFGADTVSTGTTPSTIYGTIVDFRISDGDRIDISALDANAVAAGNQAFRFIGTAAFSKVAGELRVEHPTGPSTSEYQYYVTGDTDGDGLANFTLQVFSATGVAASDLIL